MTKIEQAINSTELLLQYVLTGQGASIPIGCQFVDADYLAGGLYNALELLKEQEPVEAVEIIDDFYPIGDPLRTIGWKCGRCMERIAGYDNYCPNCGKAVKWE